MYERSSRDGFRGHQGNNRLMGADGIGIECCQGFVRPLPRRDAPTQPTGRDVPDDYKTVRDFLSWGLEIFGSDNGHEHLCEALDAFGVAHVVELQVESPLTECLDRGHADEVKDTGRRRRIRGSSSTRTCGVPKLYRP